MATRTAQAITVAGITPTYYSATATTGDQVKAGPRNWVHFKNGSGGSITVTISGVGQTAYQVDYPDKAYTIAAGAEMHIPVLPQYGDPDDSGLATIICSSVTTVTFAALRI